MQILLVTVHSIHLLVVGIGVCLPLVVILLNRKMIKLEDHGHRDAVWNTCRLLLRHSLFAIVIGSLFGFALAGVVWSEDYHQRCHLVMTKFVWAGVEWLTSVLVVTAVYYHWRLAKGGVRGFWVRSIILLIASFNLLYHLPILFMVISAIPDAQVAHLVSVHEELSRQDFRDIAYSADIVSRLSHAILAMLATAFAYVAMLGIRIANEHADGVNRDCAISICRWASRNVLIMLFVQIAFGIWALIAMPRSRMQNLIGNDFAATVLFAAGIVLFFIQLQQWTGLLGERVKRTELVKAIATLITMYFCMVGASALS